MVHRFSLLIGVCICMLVSVNTHAQDGSIGNTGNGITSTEDTLVLLADSMYNAFIPDQRIEYCDKFVRTLVRALKTENSYQYTFPKLKDKINIIAPDDKAFRVFNWVIAPSEVARRYYGAIQMAGSELKLYPLVDYTSELGKGAVDSVLTKGKWFGALYYRILKSEGEGDPVYTFIGLNASSPIANKKVMDPLRFTENGIVFGAPIFSIKTEKGQPLNRFILEYKKDVQAAMNWDESLKMVYFDRLVSSINDPARKYTYVPSGQYDGFRWSGGQWQYVQDLIPVQEFKDGEAPAPAPRNTPQGK